jgi:large subunit ribosomal protein L17e
MAIKFSYEILDPSKAAKASMDNAKVSFKKTCETCGTLRKRKLLDAIQYLKDVIAKKDCVPFTKFNRRCGNTHQARKYTPPEAYMTFKVHDRIIKKKFVQRKGRWPAKSCKFVIELLESLKEDGVSKGLDPSELVITHVQVNKAPVIYGRTFRAHGRVTPFNKKPCHIQAVAEIVSNNDISIEE